MNKHRSYKASELLRTTLPRTPVKRRSKLLLLQAFFALTACLVATILGAMRWGRIVVHYYAKGP